MTLRKIGLIGGMSFEGSAVYYRRINEAVNRRLGRLHSAEILLHSVDFETIVEMQKAGRWDAAGDRLAQVAKGLEAAGADCVMICAVTMHLVAEAVSTATTLPFLHIVDSVAERLIDEGKRKPLLIATRYTMESDFYINRMQGHGIQVMVPKAGDRDRIHSIIFDELSLGTVLETSHSTLVAIIQDAKNQGADSVIFGCTEICLILAVDNVPLPGFDSTQIHVEAAVEFALGGPSHLR